MTLKRGPGKSLTLRMFSPPCLPWSGSFLSVSLCLHIASLCFWLHFSLSVSKSVFSCVSIAGSHSANFCPCVFVSLVSMSVSVLLSFQLSPSLVVSLYFSMSWSLPLAGPGPPPESAPPVFDDSWHHWLLLRLHAPSFNAPQLNRLRLWTLAGQRHGESGYFLAEPGEVDGHQVMGKASRKDSCFLLPTSPPPTQFLNRSFCEGSGRHILANTLG